MFETTPCTLLPDLFTFKYHKVMSISSAVAHVKSTDYHMHIYMCVLARLRVHMCAVHRSDRGLVLGALDAV